LIVRVRDLLGRKPATLITIEVKADLETAVRLLIAHNIGGLPVIGPDGAVVGLVAERDVVRAVHEGRSPDQSVRQVMQPAAACGPDESLPEVMRRMTIQRHRHLVVQEAGHLLGVISVGDIVKHRLEELEMETGVLRDMVAGQRAAR
jgi:CBS domain-containing protein